MSEICGPRAVERYPMGTWSMQFGYQLPQERRYWAASIDGVEEYLEGLVSTPQAFCRAVGRSLNLRFTVEGPLIAVILEAKQQADAALEQANLGGLYMTRFACIDADKQPHRAASTLLF